MVGWVLGGCVLGGDGSGDGGVVVVLVLFFVVFG